MNQVEETINKINLKLDYPEYESFKLDKYYNFDGEQFQKLFNKLEKTQTKKILVYFNYITKRFDNIGVIDIGDTRHYDFDDDIDTMTHKGIDHQKQFYFSY